MNIEIKRIEIGAYGHTIYLYLNLLDFNLPYRFKAGLVLDEAEIYDVEFYSYGIDGGTENYLNYNNPDKELLEKIKKTKSVYIQADSEYLNKTRFLEDLNARSGYVRQSALERLNEELNKYIQDDDFFQTLLVRLNDWVEEVRIVANTVMNRWLTISDKSFVLKKLHSIYHLLSCDRTDHHEFVSKVEALLLIDKAFLNQSVFSCNFRLARNAFLLLGKEIDYANLLFNHKIIHDVIVKSKIANMIPLMKREDFEPLAETLYSSRNVHIRREALRACGKFDIDRFGKINESLYDKKRTVTESAWYMAKKYGINAIDIYKKTLVQSERVEIIKVNIVIDRVVYLKIKELEPILWDILDNCNDVLILNAVVKSLIELNKTLVTERLFNMIPRMSEDISEFAINRLENIYFTHKSWKRPSLKPDVLWQAIMDVKNDTMKARLIQFILAVSWDWTAVYICLRLTSHFGLEQSKVLGVISVLNKLSLPFGLDSEQKTQFKKWLSDNPNLLNIELYKLFERNYNSKKLLDEFPALRFCSG